MDSLVVWFKGKGITIKMTKVEIMIGFALLALAAICAFLAGRVT